MTIPEPDTYYTIPDLIELLKSKGVSRKAIRDAVKLGDLPHYDLGWRRIRGADVVHWLESRQRAGTEKT